MIEIYGIKNCNKIRDTLRWFEDHNVDFTFRDVKKQPIEAEKLADYVYKIGLDVMVNKRGMKWKQLGLGKKNLSDEELFEEMLKNQTMIKRPLIVKGEAVMVGYDEDAFEEFIN
ncbi:MAG: arsenate reductase family protein [Balneolaceae bacterium]